MNIAKVRPVQNDFWSYRVFVPNRLVRPKKAKEKISKYLAGGYSLHHTKQDVDFHARRIIDRRTDLGAVPKMVVVRIMSA